MSRRINNGGLKDLLGHVGYQIADLACVCDCSRISIWRWAAGKAPAPLLETRIAYHLRLSVPALRRAVGLDRTRKTRASRRRTPVSSFQFPVSSFQSPVTPNPRSPRK